jgi:hypothetical protein
VKYSLKFLTLALALLLLVPALYAQTPEVSTLPVTEPLDVGGTVLQPGTYLIRVVSPRADRNKVQITSLDRQTVYATVLTIPHELEPGEKVPDSMFVYFPAGEGQPRALRTWFAPDPASGGGHDIVYEESRAKQLARLANEPVVSYRGEETASLEVVTPEATVQPYVVEQHTTMTMPAPAPAPAPVATPMTSSTNTDMEMPQTASRLPMMALIGLLSLAGALVVRFARG